ncbi:SulP family inorganic anion transporter [Leucobacter viscericola]|uniref:SulP family inorganic anion transporter n=1 Tax=Leucobacter viscericola TaxID=2714935 RepID=A0A6G7XC51_9MICO|nr:SulP family inorganic anion transporter [Leucobacter viscericola]QIK62046.1 SulP family inorganic anion transporter [Leucobacter viscericola]
MATVTRRAPWFAPTLRGYKASWIGGDIIAGLSAGAVVIPQAMAYATIANLPVELGVYTCILPMIVYAFLGGSKAMSVSTTSTIATLTATTIVTAGVAAGSANTTDPGAAEQAVFTLTLLVGLILAVARLCNIGSLVENISQATLVGMKVGLGATVALGQVPKMLGVDVELSGHGFIKTLNATLEAVPALSIATLAFSAGTVAVLVLLPRIFSRIPAQLVVVFAGILLTALVPPVVSGIAVIAPVSTGLPLPTLPSFENVGALMPGALAIAVMAFLETASVARAMKAHRDPPIDSNQELLASSATNIVGAFFQCLPSAGGFSQSAVNQRAGARSQAAALVTAALAVLVLLFLAPVLSLLPQATLASMVFVAVVGLIDVRGMMRLFRLSKVEFWIAVVTALVGLSVGLLPAVAAGVVLTLGLVLHELNKPRIRVAPISAGLLEIQVLTPLYTANLLSTAQAVTAAAHTADPGTAIVVDLSAQNVISVTVLDGLRDLDSDLSADGYTVWFVNLPQGALTLAAKTSWWQRVEAEGRSVR